ncbi:MAG: redoxin domain-containing protein [Chloroflexi bacterium]|nr:redoxin domain-containing protein [Chloroflexota bacterium]
MKRSWPRSQSTSWWSALLAPAAALCLLAAAACGDAEPATAPDSDAAVSTDSSPATADSVTATTDSAPEPSTPIGHEVGNLAPDFTVETVAGESFNLSEVTAAGSPVLLYFFTTW